MVGHTPYGGLIHTMAALHRSRTSRLRAAIFAALACAMAVPVVFGHAATTCNVAGAIRRLGSSSPWLEVKAPVFPAGTQTITAYAMVPWNPDVVYATNGKSVMRSGTGGCQWDPVLTLQADGGGDVALSSQTTTITSIVLPEARNASDRVYFTAQQGSGSAARPIVIYSASGNANSYSQRSSGLPTIGAPVELAIAPSNANVLYLSLRSVPGLPVGPSIPGTPVQTTSSGALYRSTDGGSSWTRSSDGNDFDGAAAIDDISIDSGNPSTIWTVAGGQLRVSRDNGATHTYPGDLTESRQGSFTFTAVDARAGRVVGFSTRGSGGPAGLVSTNGGSTFAERKSPGTVTSVASTNRSSRLYIGTSGGSSQIYEYNISGQSSRVTPLESATDWDVQVDRVANNVHAMRPTALYRTQVASSGPPPPPEVGLPDGNVGGVPPVVAKISPKNVEISLPPGGSTTRDFTITLPPSPTKLDLYLIIDNSKSMANLIAGVQANLAGVLQNLVAKERIDVHAGAALYQTTQDPPLYQRLADIQSPNTGNVYRALNSMKADSGGQDEPVLIALHQAATGKGLNKIPGIPLSFCALDQEAVEQSLCGIPPNQNPSWRAQSLRVFVHATNERFETEFEDINDSDEVSFDETAKAMRDRQIQHIGIIAGEEARPHLTDMSRKTGTLAPTPVDCDGDGFSEVKAGTPLVCVPGDNLTRTLVTVLRAVRDVQPVGIFSRSSSPVFRGVTLPNSGLGPRPQATFSNVNVKQVNTLRYRATFSCANVAPSTTPYEVKLSAQLRGETLRGADATALVTCGALAAAPLPPPVDPAVPPGPQPQVQPQPLPAQPAPAVPVPQIQPAPQVQVNPQVNPNAGAARQEDKEYQFATATNDVMPDDNERTQLAMSALAGVALIGAFGTAHALRRREADRLAYNWNRRT